MILDNTNTENEKSDDNLSSHIDPPDVIDWGSEDGSDLPSKNEKHPVYWGDETRKELPRWLRWAVAIAAILGAGAEVVETLITLFGYG